MGFFFNFSQNLGMLSAIANVAKFAQNYPKTISLRNFEIPPKIDFFLF
jgi:hypothetical protein